MEINTLILIKINVKVIVENEIMDIKINFDYNLCNT